MNTALVALYGVAGFFLGFQIPYISLKIIKYKRGEKTELSKEFMYSVVSKSVLCIFTGAVWFMSALMCDNLFIALLVNILITTGMIIAFIDVNIRIIPNELVLAVIIFGLIFQLQNYGLKGLIPSAISMVVMMAVFSAVAGFMGFGKVGAGDVKLAGAIGFALGYPLIVIAVAVMSVVLLAFIIIGLALKKIYLSTMLPLAPFMISGFIFSLIFFFLKIQI